MNCRGGTTSGTTTVTEDFTSTEELEINTILGDFLKKNRTRSAAKKYHI